MRRLWHFWAFSFRLVIWEPWTQLILFVRRPNSPLTLQDKHPVSFGILTLYGLMIASAESNLFLASGSSNARTLSCVGTLRKDKKNWVPSSRLKVHQGLQSPRSSLNNDGTTDLRTSLSIPPYRSGVTHVGEKWANLMCMAKKWSRLHPDLGAKYKWAWTQKRHCFGHILGEALSWILSNPSQLNWSLESIVRGNLFH